MQVSALGSGSRGNALLVECGQTRILVDVGFGVRTIARRLHDAGCPPESIEAVVLTHEHTDHSQGVLACCAKWGWPLYATAGTIAALPAPLIPVRTITHGHAWSIGEIDGASISVPHDAADCAALRLQDRVSGLGVGIALDLGHVPETLPRFFESLQLLVVEANHDMAQLMAGPYPWMLKERIRGPLGHLDNRAAALLIGECMHPGLRGVLLAHLSETNNSPERAVLAVQEELRSRSLRRGAIRVPIHAAAQRAVVGPLSAYGAEHVSVGQLELRL